MQEPEPIDPNASRPENAGIDLSMMETVHCPVCMAIPRYCPGHTRDHEFPGTVVPRQISKLSVYGKGGYGRFSGDPVCRFTANGERLVLLEPFSYTDRSFKVWTATKGTILDGASIPRPFWSFVGSPLRGKYVYASIIHDYECIHRENDWKSVHRMFYDACVCGGCSIPHAKTLYYAVYHFGPRWSVESLQESRGTYQVDAFDIEKVRKFIEFNPSMRDLTETHPAKIGIIRRYGKRFDARSNSGIKKG